MSHDENLIIIDEQKKEIEKLETEVTYYKTNFNVVNKRNKRLIGIVEQTMRYLTEGIEPRRLYDYLSDIRKKEWL